jgi:hypothetical protein
VTPSLADRVLARSGAGGGAAIAGVRLRQRGEMRLRPGGRPHDGREGRLEGRVAGLRVFRSDGPDLSRGEAMRYLAELAWIPHALRLTESST